MALRRISDFGVYMKYSRQREMILRAVRENPTHPTADAIYSILKPENPGLSLGTVYRNLKLLEANGSIRKLRIAGGGDRFDGNIRDHLHFICAQCGQILDVDQDISPLRQHVEAQMGCAVQSCEMILTGTCQTCLREGAASAKML